MRANEDSGGAGYNTCEALTKNRKLTLAERKLMRHHFDADICVVENYPSSVV